MEYEKIVLKHQDNVTNNDTHFNHFIQNNFNHKLLEKKLVYKK